MCLDKDCPGGHASPSPFASVLGSETTVASASASASPPSSSSATASSVSPPFIVYRNNDGTSVRLPNINVPAFVFYEPLYERPNAFRSNAVEKAWDKAERKRRKKALAKARKAYEDEIAAGAEPAPGALGSASTDSGTASSTEEAAGTQLAKEAGASSATPSPQA